MEPRRLRALACLLPLAAACAARGPTALPEPKESGQLVFWQIESKGRPDARAWLLGSVHAGTADLTFDPAIESAFGGSDALVIEADITSKGAEGTAFIQRTLQNATLPDGQTLDQVLPAPTWQELGDFLRAHGQSAEGYRRYEPWLVMTVVTSYLFAEAGLPASGGVDLRFTGRAEGKMPIVPLETPEFQLSLLDSLPLETQAVMLSEVLERQSETRSDALLIYEAWQRGDLDLIEGTLNQGGDDPKVRDFQERVYVKRNRNMAERIDQLLAEPRTWFIVVGAGHMVGSEGIPALLAARGHRVTRIARTPEAAAAPAVR